MAKGTQVDVLPTADSATREPLAELAAILAAMPDASLLPPDYSMEVDHYLYGTPKRGQE
jgi:hypothetical protein